MKTPYFMAYITAVIIMKDGHISFHAMSSLRSIIPDTEAYSRTYETLWTRYRLTH